MQQLAYPSFITSDEYKLRSVTFTAMSHDIEKDNTDEKIQEEDQSVDDTFSSMLSSISDSAESIVNEVSSVISSGKFSIQGQIVLPLPDDIIDAQSHIWGEQTSLLYENGSEALKLTAPKVNVPAVGETVNKGINKILEKLDLGSAITHTSHLLGIRKPVLDPSFFQSYSGSALRSFSMIFNFIPESVEEAQTIQNIILTFKNWTSPSKTAGSIVMLSPLYFQIEFGNPYITQMFNMNCVVCKEIQVNYGADGNMQQFQDGFPKQITLTLAFNEAKLSYADNYKSAFSNQGTTPSNNYESLEKTTETPTIDVKN